VTRPTPKSTRLRCERRHKGVDDARVLKREVLIRRGEKWFRYGAPKQVS